MAAAQGAKVVAIDIQELVLDRTYQDAVASRRSIIPLFVDAVAPAEAVGFRENPLPHTAERLGADCVLSLGLVHHLVLKGPRISFEHLAQLLAAFARQHAIVEFVPADDRSVESWECPIPDWYTSENFEAVLRRYFPNIERFDSDPTPRILLACSK